MKKIKKILAFFTFLGVVLLVVSSILLIMPAPLYSAYRLAGASATFYISSIIYVIITLLILNIFALTGISTIKVFYEQWLNGNA